LDRTYGELLDISKKYIGNINGADMDLVWKKGIKYCDVRLLNFAKKAIKEAILIDEFKAIDKEEILEIRLGQQKGYNEIIHKIDTRVKDSKEIKFWLEDGEEDYSYSILQNLELSEGNYKEITCHNSEFSDSDLSNSNFEEASLIESVFAGSIIRGVNFKKSTLAETDFYATMIEDTNFEKATLRKANFQNSKIVNCNLYNSICNHVDFRNSVFENSNLIKTDFSFSNLENVDLSGNNLKDAEFIRVKLTGANLSNTDLTGVMFINIDFTTFKFDNAIFGNNKIKKIKIHAKDVHRLNLSEEQRKELTIVG